MTKREIRPSQRLFSQADAKAVEPGSHFEKLDGWIKVEVKWVSKKGVIPVDA